MQKNLISFGAYVTMFPHLIAGPIVQYKTIDTQLRTRTQTTEQFAEGVHRFMIGLGKKVLIANVINILLLASFLCVAVSAVFLSSTLSSLFHLKAAMLGRRMHMVFTTWSFVLMSPHVGLHWNITIGAIRKWTKRTQYLYQISLLLVSAYGLYAFISRNLLQRMFLLSEYAFFDYEEPVILLVIDYVTILCLFSNLAHWIVWFVSKRRSMHGDSNL